MLVALDIQNIALIERLSLEIKTGMTALTGETGAGKSIIIDAVSLLLGGRTNKALVRYGTDRARVQGLFDVPEKLNEQLLEQGIEPEDGQLVITREITAEGKSVCRINGAVTTQNVLREVGAYLINIHGQHDSQALLNPAKHIDFLDEYAGTDCTAFAEMYRGRRALLKEITDLSQNEQERMQRVDLLDYQVKEIEAAQLTPGEKEELLEQRAIIENAEKLAVAVNEAYTSLYEENSAYDAVSSAGSAMEPILGIDASLDDIYSRISEVRYTIEDCVHELRRYAEGIEFDENALEAIEERLDLIGRLERKYGGSVSAALEYYEQASAELERLSDADETIAQLEAQLSALEEKMAAEAAKITALRKAAAERLRNEIEASLAELDMPRVKLAAAVTPLDGYNPRGADSVEFLICPNVGEQLKPLAEIASGGELSRVMLALKSILADSVDTLIFDEIDTGVSGAAAQKIAKKLSALAKGKQVICISHQPQLAAAADNHYKIEKHTEGERTVTDIRELSREERVTELARIIDGDNLTSTAINHAREMLLKTSQN